MCSEDKSYHGQSNNIWLTRRMLDRLKNLTDKNETKRIINYNYPFAGSRKRRGHPSRHRDAWDAQRFSAESPHRVVVDEGGRCLRREAGDAQRFSGRTPGCLFVDKGGRRPSRLDDAQSTPEELCATFSVFPSPPPRSRAVPPRPGW